jgi:hypothetical protein
MGSIMSAIRDDIDEYEALCEKYGEEVQRKPTVQGIMLPDAYGEHADALKFRSRVEYAMSKGRTRLEAEAEYAYLKPKAKPTSAWDHLDKLED